MKYFLQHVAEDLCRRFGNDLSHTAVIFPNKRASLFLNEYLAQCTDKPIWAPRYMAISDFFTSLSDKRLAGPIETVCRIYRHYVRLSGNKESLDYFYGWGERLLSDFDDVDKNMADARMLFRDIRDYAGFEQYDFLDEEQVRQLQRFSSDFSKEKITTIKSRFKSLWEIMYAVYDSLRNDLSDRGEAYEGQLFREVAENMLAGKTSLPAGMEHVAFVGFNVLDKVEQTLFEVLQEKGAALFYWDYDTFYARPDENCKNEAGLFLRENLKKFPNALPATMFDNFMKERGKRVMEFANAQTELAQAQTVRKWLEDPNNYNAADGKRTAVVLCNENLLQPVLHALPENARDTNVTKGFPLGHTPAYACVNKFIESLEQEHNQKAKGKGNKKDEEWPEGKDCLRVLESLQETIKSENRKTLEISKDDDMLHDLYIEAYFQTYTTISRFCTLVSDDILQVQLPTLLRLLRQTLHTLSIPFHGEPLKGLQVMGVLETRCLDFDNVIMLSVGEGTLPQKASDASFIPFLIRKLHHLTTPDRQISVYAYYFYRLLQRATRVRLCYNVSTEGTQRGEMSRFMRTLLAEASDTLEIKRLDITASLRPLPPLKPKEAKEHGDFIERVQRRGISPSALKMYFKCPLQFYYRHIKRLRTPQAQDAIINNNDFGTVFHKAAENIFGRDMSHGGCPVTPETISRYMKEGGETLLSRLTGEAFEEVNRERAGKGAPPIPDTAIARHAIEKYLKLLLHFESGKNGKKAPAIEMRDFVTEHEESMVIDVSYGDKKIPVRLYGNIDRRDEAVLPDGTKCLRIIDYKTGKKSEKDKIKDIDGFFTDSKFYPENALQALIYSLMWEKADKPVVPMLYYVPSMNAKDFSPYICIGKEIVTDFRTIAGEFREKLTGSLSKLIDPSNEFMPTEVEDHCKYCDYKLLCGK